MNGTIGLPQKMLKLFQWIVQYSIARDCQQQWTLSNYSVMCRQCEPFLCVADADILFCSCGFYLLSFFLTYSQRSEIGCRSEIACLPYFHIWCGLSVNLQCIPETCCMWLAENAGRKKSPKNGHLCTIAQLCRAISSQLRHISTIRKNVLNSNVSSTCSHSMVNFGLLTAVIVSEVLGIPADFSRLRVLISLLHRRRSTEVNETLHDVWPCPRLVHYIHIFGAVAP